MEDLLKRMQTLTESLSRVDRELVKKGIFEHDTLDEANPKLERVRSDVTVQIGSPGTHIRFVVLTRAEHTRVKDTVLGILQDRRASIINEIISVSRCIAD